MKRTSLLIVLSFSVLQGCGKGRTEDADPNQAGPALRTALAAWQSGKTQQELVDQKPSILMNEDDWRVGKRLLEFKMEETSTMFGRQVRWRAQIKLQDKNGKTEERTATYIIDTTPRIVIVRDSFAS